MDLTFEISLSKLRSDFLTWHGVGIFNILRHGADGFTSPPKKGVLRIFIALKNPSPEPGLNP
jgi:hypothetical protein